MAARLDFTPTSLIETQLASDKLAACHTFRGIMTATAEMQAKIKAAKERLDAHVREMVEWHFNPETGCPYWLEKAKSFNFDPRKDVQVYEDLDKFDFFEDGDLRGGPVRKWVPKGNAGKPIYVFETGGSTGSGSVNARSTGKPVTRIFASGTPKPTTTFLVSSSATQKSSLPDLTQTRFTLMESVMTVQTQVSEADVSKLRGA